MPAQGFSFIALHGQEALHEFSGFLRDTRSARPKYRLGASTFLPRKAVGSTKAIVNEFAKAANYVIMDPDTRMLEREPQFRGKARRQLAYLKGQDPTSDPVKFVNAVLAAQAATGAQVLVSPWLVHGASATHDELNATLDFARIAAKHKLGRSHRIIYGVEATWKVFANEDARADFADELADLPKAPIYLRMRVSPPRARMQYRQKKPLSGLREIVELLAQNERPVLLPQIGLCGWLMLPFGATAFGAGMAASLQRSTAPGSGEGGGGGGGGQLQWWFLPQFLGFVLAEELPDLSRVGGFVPCQCPACAGSLPSTKTYDPMWAGTHFLYWCARLANDFNGSRRAPAGILRKHLEAARSFWNRAQQAKVTLDDRSIPKHLEAWIEVAK